MKKKRELAPLLQMEAPILSDEPSPRKTQPLETKQQGKSWRKRLFGGGGKKRNQKDTSIPHVESVSSLPHMEATFSHSNGSVSHMASSSNEDHGWEPLQGQQGEEDQQHHEEDLPMQPQSPLSILDNAGGENQGSSNHKTKTRHGRKEHHQRRKKRQQEDNRDDSTASTNTTNQVIEELLQMEGDLMPTGTTNALQNRSRSSKSSSSKKSHTSKSKKGHNKEVKEQQQQQQEQQEVNVLKSRTRSSSSKKKTSTKQQPKKLDAAVAQLAPSFSSSSTTDSASSIHSGPQYESEDEQQYNHDDSPSPKLSKAGSTLTVKALLSRPFGRENLNETLQTYVVKVSSAEWEPEESLWKYRIIIQKRVVLQKKERLNELTNGYTSRSLTDFAWLEQSLMKEYHGGLLLPSLAITLGVPDLENTQHEVDAQLLTNWLSDVLNGVRGQGELLLTQNSTDIVASESMEAFLYSNSSPLKGNMDAAGILAMPDTQDGGAEKPEGEANSDLQAIFKALPDLLCSGGCQYSPTTAKERSKKVPLKFVNCSSQALGDAGVFEVKDSFVDYTSDPQSAAMVAHSGLLEAEKDLVWGWRTRALSATEKMRIMTEQEKHIGAAWKRVAISISNLFAYEKDVETARFGDSKSKRDVVMPYRKLQKSAVDDCLRVIARQKVERSSPALDALNAMLNAYIADLSAVGPSVDSYMDGVRNWSTARTRHALMVENRKTKEKQRKEMPTLTESFKAGLEQVKKLAGGSPEEDDSEGKQLEEEQQRHQLLRTVEFRIVDNGKLLRSSLTNLCKSAPVRTARLAYRYFNIEAMQCAMLHSAAATMRGKISCASKESLAKMVRQHDTETKEDLNCELQLVQRLVNLGNSKKLNGGSFNEGGVEIDNDIEDEEAQKAALRSKALENCRNRIGRWDAKTALSILQAVGIEDADVRVDETTRDLRMIRKYAIGLRENLQRCVDALETLKSSIYQGSSGDIRVVRKEFIAEMQHLFSTAYIPVATTGNGERKMSVPTFAELDSAGINLSDPCGWRRRDKGSCGVAVASYMDTREGRTESLIDTLGEMLKEYFLRVEAVESFVYMDCVGIQLEKHFSQNRASALAAFEKKTDITSAINIATRKKMPLLVNELQAKLEGVGADVSHTTVKEAKETHLESKTLKGELHDLAVRRLTRARETSTERVIALMALWSREEEAAASSELKILKDVIRTIEVSIHRDAVDAYLGASE